MFNQSGEQRPGWYVLAVRLAKITSSAFSSVNRLRSVPRLGPLAADPNARPAMRAAARAVALTATNNVFLNLCGASRYVEQPC
jgi:hypothetical protein